MSNSNFEDKPIYVEEHGSDSATIIYMLLIILLVIFSSFRNIN